MATINTPQVRLINGRSVTSSRDIANYFGKQHQHVTQKIKSIECSDAFLTSNFSLVPYEHNGNTYTEYFITRDGFTFLAMGFTGKKAAEFKEAYIKAFSEMEDRLRRGGEQEPLITAEEREILRVATVSFTRHFPYFQSKATSHLHRTLKKRYNLTKWELMPKKLLPTVLADVRSLDRQAHYLTQYIWKLEFAFLFWVLKPNHDPESLRAALTECVQNMLSGVNAERKLPADPNAINHYRS